MYYSFKGTIKRFPTYQHKNTLVLENVVLDNDFFPIVKFDVSHSDILNHFLIGQKVKGKYLNIPYTPKSANRFLITKINFDDIL
jgi:hypothetical protein